MSFWIRHSIFVFPIVTSGVTHPLLLYCTISSLSMLNKTYCVVCIKEICSCEFGMTWGWVTGVICSFKTAQYQMKSLCSSIPTEATTEAIIRRGQWEARVSLLKVVCEFVAQVEVRAAGRIWMRKRMHAGAGAWMCEKAYKLLEPEVFLFTRKWPTRVLFMIFAHRHARVKSKLDTRTHSQMHKETHTDGAHGGSTGIWRND